MYRWNIKRYTSKCEKCGGIIEWTGHIGTCTGRCNNPSLAKHKSAKAICGEIANVKDEIKLITLKLIEYTKLWDKTLAIRNKVDRLTYNDEYDVLKRFWQSVLHNREIRGVIINAVTDHIQSARSRLLEQQKVLTQKWKELGKTQWKRDA